jgi:hypothetical protein
MRSFIFSESDDPRVLFLPDAAGAAGAVFGLVT